MATVDSKDNQPIFKKRSEMPFWDVHNPKKTLAITLKDTLYDKLVPKVKDPETDTANINETIVR